MFCGHSLGASIAEALHCLFHSSGGYSLKCDDSKRVSKIISSGAVTFDSPGQPEAYRIDNSFTKNALKDIWTLNNRPNFINMLNPPCASHFYVCGNEFTFFFVDIADMNLVVESFPALVLSSAYSILKSLVVKMNEGHYMAKISKCIRNRNFDASNPLIWPTYTGDVLRVVFRVGGILRLSPGYIVLRYIMENCWKTDTKEDVELSPTLHPAFNDLAVFPSMWMEVEERKPYKIRTCEQFEQFFNNHCDQSYALLPLVGISGQGKTHTLAKMIDENVDNDLTGSPLKKFIGEGVNNSLIPIIVLWKVTASGERIYAFDMPGLGDGHIDRNFYKGGENFNDMISQHRAHISRVIVVISEKIHFHQRNGDTGKLWRSLGALFDKNIKITVAYNTAETVEKDGRVYCGRLQHYQDQFKKLEISKCIHETITYCAWRSPKDRLKEPKRFDIQHLTDHLDSIIPQVIEDANINRQILQAEDELDKFKKNQSIERKKSFVPLFGPLKSIYDNVRQEEFDLDRVVLDGFSLLFEGVAVSNPISLSAGFVIAYGYKAARHLVITTHDENEEKKLKKKLANRKKKLNSEKPKCDAVT